MSTDIAALAWAKQLNIGNTLYKYIPEGGLFRFATGTTIYRRGRGGWYAPVTGGAPYRTGARTAVVAIHDETG